FSVVFTPAQALIMIGNTADRTMIVTCIVRVNPRKRMNNGTRAMRGIEEIAHTYGLRMASMYLLAPMSRPNGMPMRQAIPTPIPRLLRLKKRWSRMLPDTTAPGGAEVVRPSHKAASMSVARGRNKGLMMLRRAINSQRAKKAVRLIAVTTHAPQRRHQVRAVYSTSWMRSEAVVSVGSASVRSETLIGQPLSPIGWPRL